MTCAILQSLQLDQLSTASLLLLLALLLLTAIEFLARHRTRLPPGPIGLPIIGVAPWLLAKRRDKYFTELAAEYGDVFTIRVGLFNIVVLNSIEAIKEAFAKNEDISGRGLRAFSKFMTDGKGIASNEGPQHRQQRRYCLRVLRDFGFGRLNFESSIQHEVDELSEELDKLAGRAQPVDQLVAMAISNVIGQILHGSRLLYTNPQLLRVTRALQNLNSAPAGVILLNTTSLLDFASNAFGMGKLVAAREAIRKFLKPIVLEHRRRRVEESDDVTDFLYAYLIEQAKHKGKEDEHLWDDRQLEEVLIDLMVAGSDTTKSTLLWSLNLLCHKPNVQESVRRELISVLGNRTVSTSDLPQLPITDAFLQEVLRFSALVPTAVPHSCTRTTTLYNYQLPLGTMVLANTFCLTRDRKVFKNPDKFDPFGHFLESGEDGTMKVVNKDKILPFCYGRRSCIGESLARMELLLFTAGLLRRFRVRAPEGAEPDTEGTGGLFNACRLTSFVFERLTLDENAET